MPEELPHAVLGMRGCQLPGKMGDQQGLLLDLRQFKDAVSVWVSVDLQTGKFLQTVYILVNSVLGVHRIEVAVVEVLVEAEEVGQFSHQVVVLVDVPLPVDGSTAPSLQRRTGDLSDSGVALSLLLLLETTSLAH
jgi:hypothetical protein